MKGFGEAGGALTVVNAVACGLGSAFGVDLKTTAEVTIDEKKGFTLEINGQVSDSRFAEILIKSLDSEISGAEVKTFSNIPIGMGLKSSSAAANSIIMATADALGKEISPLEIAKIGSVASVKAGVSITGAFDDSCASILGGLVFTDNTKNELVKKVEMDSEKYIAVIRVADKSSLTANFPKDKFAMKKNEILSVYNSALSGNAFEAMYENGKYVSDVLGIKNATADFAKKCGAITAGISGTGSAVGIIVEKKKLDDFLDKFGRENCIVTELRNGAVNDRSF